MITRSTEIQRAFFEKIYLRFNRDKYIHPDPLEFVLRYDDPADQEVAGLIASSFALGNVTAILKCVESVLKPLGRPAAALRMLSGIQLRRRYADFRYRFYSEDDLYMLLAGMQGCLGQYQGIGHCFQECLTKNSMDMVQALSEFVRTIHEFGGGTIKLLPLAEKGSACKRLNLYLRWMVRRDSVDPGPWPGIPASVLIVPMDTHMLRISRRLEITRRKQADMKTAAEVTAFFRTLRPDDPVRYDFSLTRMGIHPDLSYDRLNDIYIS